MPQSVEIPFSEPAKRVLEDARREADQMSARPITTGHLLLGLLQADGTTAHRILHAAGLRVGDARRQVQSDVEAGLEPPGGSSQAAPDEGPST